MKVLLIAPIERYKPKVFIERRFHFVIPSLGLIELARLASEDVDVSIVEETYEDIPYEEDADLVGISLHAIPTYRQAFAISDRFRSRGIPTVLGGKWIEPIVTEAREHFDAIAIGDAERVWADIIRDGAQRRLKPVYRGSQSADFPPPDGCRKRLTRGFELHGARLVQPVILSKGCPYRCDFCSVSAFYQGKHRLRPIEEAVREVEEVEAEYIFIVDDNLYVNPRYMIEFFSRVAPLRKKINGQVTVEAARDTAFLCAAEKGGLVSALVGLETLTPENLAHVGKPHNRVEDYGELVRRFSDHGVGVAASFVYGFDGDGPETFDRILAFADANPVAYLLHSILTPYPGTPLFDRLKAEGRILTENWERYDREHAVFRPARMTCEELEGGYRRAKAARSEWRMESSRPPSP